LYLLADVIWDILVMTGTRDMAITGERVMTITGAEDMTMTEAEGMTTIKIKIKTMTMTETEDMMDADKPCGTQWAIHCL
jgi:hypothetical protein